MVSISATSSVPVPLPPRQLNFVVGESSELTAAAKVLHRVVTKEREEAASMMASLRCGRGGGVVKAGTLRKESSKGNVEKEDGDESAVAAALPVTQPRASRRRRRS